MRFVFPQVKDFETPNQWIEAINNLGARIGARPMDNLGLLLLIAQGDEARFWNQVVAEGMKAPQPSSDSKITIEQQLEESFKIQKSQIQKEEK